MGSHHYDIKHINGTWVFKFMPNNNNNQEMGASAEFSDKKECIAALNKFKSVIKEYLDNGSKSDKVNFIKNKNNSCYVEVTDGKNVLYKTREYGESSSCQKCFKSLCDKIDSEIRNFDK